MNAQMDDHFQHGREVIQLLERNGYQAFFIGGCVRDLLLKRPITDIDLCTSAKPWQIMELFPRTIPTGLQHGTITVMWKKEQIEVTTFRTEDTYKDHRHPDQVHYVSTLSEDIMRRDFTINAIAMDKDGKITDYVQGVKDLQKQLIRTVGKPKERFSEDALRMLRALRFGAQLGFTIEEGTYQTIKECKELLSEIAVERIAAEFQKIMKADRIELGLRTLLETGIAHSVSPLSSVYPALIKLADLPLHHLSEEERWCMLLLLINEEDQALRFLKRCMLPKEFGRRVGRLARLGYLFSQYIHAQQFTNLDLIKYDTPDLLMILKINIFLQHRLNENVNRIYQTQSSLLQEKINQLPIQSSREIALSGKDLMQFCPGRKTGPWIQHTLDVLLQAIAAGKVENKREALIAYVWESEWNESE